MIDNNTIALVEKALGKSREKEEEKEKMNFGS